MPHSDQDFKIYAPLEAFEKAGDDNPMRIGGMVSTDRLDKEGERILQEGLDFNPFLNEGWFNDNHGRKTGDVVGYPTETKFVRKGEKLPNGKTSTTNGWWAEGHLVNTDKGREIWGLAQALQGTKRKLGFSIEGRVQQRDPRDPSRVTKAVVKHVAVTHCPVNTDTELESLSKALMAGSSISNPGTSPGEGFALRGESLEGSPDHPTKKAKKAPPSNQSFEIDEDEALEMVKAEAERDFDVQEMSELDLLRSWAPIISQRVAITHEEDRLTKAEARLMVSAQIPTMSAVEVDAFLSNLATE